MTTFPPAHIDPPVLTAAQSDRLNLLPADCVVVCVDDAEPVVRQASGRLMRVDANGDLRKASNRARRSLEHRLIDIVFPRVA